MQAGRSGTNNANVMRLTREGGRKEGGKEEGGPLKGITRSSSIHACAWRTVAVVRSRVAQIDKSDDLTEAKASSKESSEAQDGVLNLHQRLRLLEAARPARHYRCRP